MHIKTIHTITLIGSGNIAYNVGNVLVKSGFEIHEVYSRTLQNAKKLAKKLQAKPVADLEQLSRESDLYIIAVSDDSIAEIVKEISLSSKLVVHTSGSVDINVLKEFSSNYGSFYPLQTFTKSHLVDFKEIPICIEGNTKSNQNLLKELADKISNQVILMNSIQRQKIHLAAVFTANFTNFMQVIAQDICESEGVDFQLLKPLIKEVYEKNLTQKAEDNQTGPARRGDDFTIQKHLELLHKNSDLRELYTKMTELIHKKYKK